MQIISRQHAIREGLPKYFTGEPCKNGHVAMRYLQSGTCEQCIRGSAPATPERSAQRLDLQQKRIAIEQQKLEQRERRLKLNEAKLALSEKRIAARPKPKRDGLVEIRALLHYGDVETFKLALLASAMLLDPTITMPELMTNKTPETHGHRSIHTFRCFGVDFKGLHIFASNIDRDRRARGDDEDELAYRAEMRRRADEDARALAEEDNGRPERLDA